MTEQLLKILEDWHVCPESGKDFDVCPAGCKHRQPIVTPLLAVDIIIERLDWKPFNVNAFSDIPPPSDPQEAIVLIERKNEPHGYSLPGGFVDVGESCIAAAAREALEEVKLTVTNLRLFGVYSDPQRDPRGHVVSMVYVGQAIGTPEAADDAKKAITVETEGLGRFVEELCFDHARILTDYLVFKRNGQRPTQ